MMADTKRLENAIARAMAEKGDAIRAAYSDMQRKYMYDERWYQNGAFDKQLARSYARIIAPRVVEILGDAR